METENIERIIEKEDEVHPKTEEEEKSVNEEEEESDANNEENTQNLESNHQTEQSQENEQEKDEKNNEQNLEEKEKGGVVDPYATTTYILKYRRTKEELKELAVETNLPKSESCYFMINIKLTKSDNADMTNSNTDISNENIEPKFLVISCHEIAAIYMDEIYERKYTLNDLCKEIKYFKIFDKIEEARNVIDESLKNNKKSKNIKNGHKMLGIKTKRNKSKKKNEDNKNIQKNENKKAKKILIKKKKIKKIIKE